MSDSGVHFRNRHTGGSEAGGVVTRETHGAVGFDPAVGGLPVGTARDGEQTQLPDLAPGAVDGSIVAPGALEGYHFVPRTLTRELFASTISVPEIVDALPVLPDADNYPQGSLVFLTTDGKLYRTTGGVSWTVEVDGNDLLAGSVVAGKVAAAAIGADEIAAGAIDTEHFQVTAKAPQVENADSSVVIQPDGILITEGHLIFQDAFGETVLTGAGFGPSWSDFIQSGVFNSRFLSGDDGVVAWSPDLLSASVSLPHWAAWQDALGMTITRMQEVGSVYRLRFQTTVDTGAATIATEKGVVPWYPGQYAVMELFWEYTKLDENFVQVQVAVEYLDAQLNQLDIEMDQHGIGGGSASASEVLQFSFNGAYAGPQTRYIRAWIQVTCDVGDVVDLFSVRLVPGTLRAESLTVGDNDGSRVEMDSSGTLAVTNAGAEMLRVGTDGSLTWGGVFGPESAALAFDQDASLLLMERAGGPGHLKVHGSVLAGHGVNTFTDVTGFESFRSVVPHNGYPIFKNYDVSAGLAWPTFQINGAGGVGWGTGLADVDTVLQRSGAGQLELQGGALIIDAQDGVNEGGELQLKGAGANTPWTMDVYSNRIRWHKDGVERLGLTASTLTLTGALAVTGAINGSTNWANLALSGGWANYDAINWFPAQYRKDASGIVHLRGLIKSGTIGATAFTLPAGFRPGRLETFPVISNDAIGRVTVGGSGAAQPVAPSSNAWVSLSGISFQAEN